MESIKLYPKMFEEFQWRPEEPQFPNRLDGVEAEIFLRSALAMEGKMPHELVLDGARHYLSDGQPRFLLNDPDELHPAEIEGLCTLLSAINDQFAEVMKDDSSDRSCILLHQDSCVIRREEETELAVVFRVRTTSGGLSFQNQPIEYLMTHEALFALPGHPTLMTATADLEDPGIFCLEAHFDKSGLAAMQECFVQQLDCEDIDIFQESFIGQRLLENFPIPESEYQDPTLAAATAVENISLVQHRNSKLHLKLETHEHGTVRANVHLGRFYKNLEIEFAVEAPPDL